MSQQINTSLASLSWQDSPADIETKYPSSFVIRRRPLGQTYVVPRFMTPHDHVSLTAEIEFEGQKISYVSLRPMLEERLANWSLERTDIVAELKSALSAAPFNVEYQEDWDDFEFVVSIP